MPFEAMPADTPAQAMGTAVLSLLSKAPAARTVADPEPQAAVRRLTREAAAKAAMAAGSLALPPGPLGWLTLLPELLAVWRIQAQLVADIAGVYGQSHAPNQSQMLYCLYRHTAAQAVRDLGVRVGQRILISELTQQGLQKVVGVIGIQLSSRLLGSGVSRWVPLIGAAGVAAYAWADTRQVAAAAEALFSPPAS
ncbi:hypothetical protein [Ideonella sp.]|uniref:hypothetical protein n=1 Tax=Ideonella sp. TaxID=1929293 RepID=UPI003BB631C8